MFRFWNSSGEEVGACGNGTRCAAWLLMEASGKDETTFETKAGILKAWRAGHRMVTVDMGKPGLDWRDIPLSEDMDTRGHRAGGPDRAGSRACCTPRAASPWAIRTWCSSCPKWSTAPVREDRAEHRTASAPT